ncbi:hypothetical protein [Chengkuizengella axinellae]|uniref:Uncharacterized protein n=1 Tax=Chengkuizengella axinellae TaxID=3064388 RepID=A0ABT9ITZ2_9BACL|nr:hypothetical protein [Chengkuizengella sp. 2205SS18-9]MDP5272814.1 hypothetical protein [Chengkuizengella sp. 2205SS18-9]
MNTEMISLKSVLSNIVYNGEDLKQIALFIKDIDFKNTTEQAELIDFLQYLEKYPDGIQLDDKNKSLIESSYNILKKYKSEIQRFNSNDFNINDEIWIELLQLMYID